MARTLTLNGKEYNIDELSDEAKQLANNVVFADAKLNQLQNEAAVIQTGRSAYVQALTKLLEEPTEQSDS
jgi:hypothetical protein